MRASTGMARRNKLERMARDDQKKQQQLGRTTSLRSLPPLPSLGSPQRTARALVAHSSAGGRGWRRLLLFYVLSRVDRTLDRFE